jgi:hypothetical protein
MSMFVVEYLREYESIFETSHESVDPGAVFDDKKPEVVNLVNAVPY